MAKASKEYESIKVIKHLRSSGLEEELELCVNCGKETRYKKSDHIDTRLGYIEGAGQLCSRCSYTKTFIKGMHV